MLEGAVLMSLFHSMWKKPLEKKRVKIKATIDGEPYRGTLVRMGSPQHMLLVLKEIREKVGKSFGDKVAVELEEDIEPALQLRFHPVFGQPWRLIQQHRPHSITSLVYPPKRVCSLDDGSQTRSNPPEADPASNRDASAREKWTLNHFSR